MRRYLQLDGNVVTGVLDSTAAPPSELPDGRQIVEFEWNGPTPIGATYDPETKELTPRADDGPVVSARAFALLFTPTSYLQIKAAAAQNPALGYFFDLATLAEPIRLQHATTVAGLQQLVDVGLITSEDKDRITSNTPPGR